MKILAQIVDGKLAMSEHNTKVWHDYKLAEENQGRVIVIQDRLPESKKMRRYYFGAVLRLLAYLNGWNHRDSETIDFLHEEMKREFNGQIEYLAGKEVRIGKSTKGLLVENDKANSGYVERVISYIEENYGVDRGKVLNSEHYKDFIDRIYSDGKYDDYITYLVGLNLLPRIECKDVFKD